MSELSRAAELQMFWKLFKKDLGFTQSTLAEDRKMKTALIFLKTLVVIFACFGAIALYESYMVTGSIFPMVK
jgi:hypothetical protein